MFESTRLFRVYSPTLVPDLLRTEDYTRAILSSNARLLGFPDDSTHARRRPRVPKPDHPPHRPALRIRHRGKRPAPPPRQRRRHTGQPSNSSATWRSTALRPAP
ncbi:Scr1 family TA system antitoxin-like transcriptional regulator [Streptomyces sp. NPDC051771]|uniref:Scr1 family TA system antitoxin-like transcriptional regulator n=1 Tax=Streptomyces sp. NPDC051771 TaxID=3154847 RepID=UPI00343D7F38